MIAAARAVVAAVALLGLAGCGGDEGAVRESAEPRLRDVTSVGDFKRLFNGDHGTPRLVVLLSPT